MRIAKGWLRKQMAGWLVLFLAIPLAETATASQQQALSGQEPQSMSSPQNQLLDSNGQTAKPGTDTSRAEATFPDAPDPVGSQADDRSGQSSTPQSSPPQSGTPQSSAPQSGTEPSQNGAPKPVGTAAAPYEKTTGVAASRPAGAVIAPAKQRRARSILIRVSVVVGAAVAIGTVVALSHASPSRPN